MTVQNGPATKGQKEIKTKWPVEEGLTAGSTKQTGKRFLHPEEKSLVSCNQKKGIY